MRLHQEGRTLRNSYIFQIPFNFTAVARSTETTVNVNVNQGDLLVHAITIWNTVSANDDPNIYYIRLLNREYGQSLMSDFVAGLGILQTDAQTPFRLPSPWFVRKGTRLECTLRNPSDQQLGTLTGSSYTVTVQVCLICECFAQGLQQVPEKQPFFLSYFAPLGFQEDTTSGGNVVNSANIYPSYQASWPPLLWDFELTSISINGVMFNYSEIDNLYMLQVIERRTKRQLYSSPGTHANVAGGRIEDVLNAMALADPTGLPTANSMTHNLAIPLFCKRGSQLTSKLSYNLNYTSGSVGALSNLNQVANVCLIGNKFEAPRYPNAGAFK